ncbi:kinesin-domain-containing protein [Ramicandelaber brevisporus]|nr:kinesin-domain-containing protein [Ramicandelaber brevisporus]
MSQQFLATLRKAELEQHYPTFYTNGIADLDTLAKLTPLEYSSYGVVAPNDRVRLTQLIEQIRQQQMQIMHSQSQQTFQQQQQQQQQQQSIPVNGRPSSLIGLRNQGSSGVNNGYQRNSGYDFYPSQQPGTPVSMSFAGGESSGSSRGVAHSVNMNFGLSSASSASSSSMGAPPVSSMGSLGVGGGVAHRRQSTVEHIPYVPQNQQLQQQAQQQQQQQQQQIPTTATTTRTTRSSTMHTNARRFTQLPNNSTDTLSQQQQHQQQGVMPPQQPQLQHIQSNMRVTRSASKAHLAQMANIGNGDEYSFTGSASSIASCSSASSRSNARRGTVHSSQAPPTLPPATQFDHSMPAAPSFTKRSNTSALTSSPQSHFASSSSLSLSSAAVTTSTSRSGNGGYSGDLTDKIRVCVRKRPLNSKERAKGESDIITVNGRRSLAVHEPKVKLDLTKYVEEHQFMFDEVFDSYSSNMDVYMRTARPLVDYIFEGGNATCFAYGQTGSGKSWTTLHPKDGLYALAANDLFEILSRAEYVDRFDVYVSFYEIYQGQLYDLFNDRKKLFAREDGKQQVVIAGLQEVKIQVMDELMEVFEFGNKVRTTGTTGANDDSSRSHAILQVVLRDSSKRGKIHGKLSFIDLAGSERGADRGDTTNQTRMEGAEINKSLLALKECIRALDLNKRHTPFRQSKLTQVLKDSFVGNSRTCMIATISPNLSNSDHTLNTLRYADRVKEMKGTSNNDGNSYDNDTADDAGYGTEDSYYSGNDDDYNHLQSQYTNEYQQSSDYYFNQQSQQRHGGNGNGGNGGPYQNDMSTYDDQSILPINTAGRINGDDDGSDYETDLLDEEFPTDGIDLPDDDEDNHTSQSPSSSMPFPSLAQSTNNIPTGSSLPPIGSSAIGNVPSLGPKRNHRPRYSTQKMEMSTFREAHHTEPINSRRTHLNEAANGTAQNVTTAAVNERNIRRQSSAGSLSAAISGIPSSISSTAPKLGQPQPTQQQPPPPPSLIGARPRTMSTRESMLPPPSSASAPPQPIVTSPSQLAMAAAQSGSTGLSYLPSTSHARTNSSQRVSPPVGSGIRAPAGSYHGLGVNTASATPTSPLVNATSPLDFPQAPPTPKAIPTTQATTNTRSQQQQSQQQQQQTSESSSAATSNDAASPIMKLNLHDMPDFMRKHRNEIRETTEYCKQEASMISRYDSASAAALANGTSEAERTKAALEYLEELDVLLEQKQNAVIALRNRIRKHVYG